MSEPTPPPPGILRPGVRHLALLAHQDDELPYAGLLQRMPGVHVAFLTNGDGLHFELGMEPEPYADLRRAESSRALDEIGVGEPDISFLEFSELEFYAAFGAMSASSGTGPIPAVFERAYEAVAVVVDRVQPDVIWTMAWQGGNPEHDLVNLCARRAAKVLESARRVPVPLFEFPAYELLLLVMRFGPWYDGAQHEITLTDDELDAKKRMLGMYPTQTRVIDELRRAIKLRGLAERVRGRSFTFEDFARREVFGAVPAGRDPRRSTHRLPVLDYPLDDWKGQRIRFERTLGRIGAAWSPLLR